MLGEYNWWDSVRLLWVPVEALVDKDVDYGVQPGIYTKHAAAEPVQPNWGVAWNTNKSTQAWNTI